MAKAARGVDRKQVRDWFSGLTFEVQQSVIDDLEKSHEASKADRITSLEKELASLRGGPGKAASVRASKARVADKRKGPSPKKGMKVEPKYRHPSSGQTWAGRGVYPTWINDYLKKRGNKLDDLLIRK